MALLLGLLFTQISPFLKRFCIPAPVSGGLLLILYGALVVVPSLGRNYDAAVLVSSLCGFGLGATPNAMANMSAVCYKYRYSVKPFIIVTIIGTMFVDLINTGVITLFMNFI